MDDIFEYDDMFSHKDECICLDDVTFKTDIGTFKQGSKADEVLINFRTKKLKIKCNDKITIFSFTIVIQSETEEVKIHEDRDFYVFMPSKYLVIRSKNK